jgi:tripartite-type tricarboxylate transporter receptor subunit TctC
LVGFAAGGPADLVVRPITQKLQELLGQPFVVDYRPGANMSIASDLVSKASPDGYTLLATTSAFTINPVAFSRLPYDTIRDFSPISSKQLKSLWQWLEREKIRSITDHLALEGLCIWLVRC